MRLTRCKDQKSKTLEEFYGEIAEWEDKVSREGGIAMLSLIARLQSTPDERIAFGLTSHASLVLLAEDTGRSPWFVCITVVGSRSYFIEFLLPETSAPWPDAHVREKCRSEDEAVRMIEIAMERSGGWRSDLADDA